MKSGNVIMKRIVILGVLSFMPMVVYGQSQGNKGGGRPQGPPPEAIEACDGKSSGDSVSFKGRRGESVSAVCKEINGQLVAVPEGMEAPQ